MSHTWCIKSLMRGWQLLPSPTWDMDFPSLFLVPELTTDTWRAFSCIVGSHFSPRAGSSWKSAEEQDNRTGFIQGTSLDWCFLARSKLHSSVGNLELGIYCSVINVLSLPREVLPLLPLGSDSSPFHRLNQPSWFKDPK